MTSKNKLSIRQRLYKIPNRIIQRVGVFLYKHPKSGAVIRSFSDPIVTKLFSGKFELPNLSLTKTDKKRVFIIMTYLEVGGVSQVMLNIIKGFDRRKYDLQIITTVEHHNPWHDKFAEHVDGILHIKNDELFKPNQPNAFKRMFLVDYVTNSNPHAILMTNSLLFYHLLPQLRKRIPDVPIYDILHTHGTPDQDDAYLKLSRPFDKYLTKRIVINEYLREYYIKKYHINSEKVVVIYNNITSIKKIGRLTNRQEKVYQKHKDKMLVTYIGRLELDKSPMRLVRIAKRIKTKSLPIAIIVVGDGSQMTQLKQQAIKDKTLGKTIEFIGYSGQPIRAMRLSDYTLLVSTMEGLPMSVLESMSVGVPAIASAVGGIPEIIEDREDGFLVEITPSNEQRIVAEFTNAIVAAYGLDLHTKKNMRQAAQQKIKEKFSSMTNDYNALVN